MVNLKVCNFCQKEFAVLGVEGFCSDICLARSKKSLWTTMSLKHPVRNRLILLQNDILQKTNRKIPYTNLINHILDIIEKLTGTNSLADRIINDYKYYL